MSTFIPNTTVSIYRAVLGEPDEYGYSEADNSTPLASGVHVSITEANYRALTGTDQTQYSAASLRTTLVEEFTIRFRPGVDIREDDRVRDERNNTWFEIRNIVRPYATVGYADIRVSATRVDTQ